MSRIDEALAKAGVSRAGADLAAGTASRGQAGPPDVVAAAAQAADAGLDKYPIEALQQDSGAEDTPRPEQRDTVLPDEGLEARATHARLPSHAKLIGGQADAATVEQYRRLAGRMHLAQAERGTRVLVVTSALQGEGKTLTAANLALTLSESYKKKVLLIDADLRRPSIHELFGVPNVAGLNDGLSASIERKVPVFRFSSFLSVVTAGRPEADPMSVFAGERMRRILTDAASSFDWVILDTPPVAVLTDAHLLASLVDGVLLVVRSGSTPFDAISKAVAAVGRERVLGVVLNRAEAALPQLPYYEYHYGVPDGAGLAKSAR